MGIYTAVEAANRSGVTSQTWSKVEAGKPAKPATYRKIEDLLNWMPGSCGSVLAGGEPHGDLITTADQAAASELVTLSRADLTRILDAVDALRAEMAAALGRSQARQ